MFVRFLFLCVPRPISQPPCQGFSSFDDVPGLFSVQTYYRKAFPRLLHLIIIKDGFLLDYPYIFPHSSKMTMAGAVYQQTAVASRLTVAMLTLKITYWQQTFQEASSLPLPQKSLYSFQIKNAFRNKNSLLLNHLCLHSKYILLEQTCIFIIFSL